MIILKAPDGGDVHIDEQLISEITFLPHSGFPAAKSTVYISGKPRAFANKPEEVAAYLSGKISLIRFDIPGNPPQTVWVNKKAIERTDSHHSHGTKITISGRNGHLHVAESKAQIDSQL